MKISQGRAFVLGKHVESKGVKGDYFKLIAIDICRHVEIDRLTYGSIQSHLAADHASPLDQVHMLSSAARVFGLLVFSKRFFAVFTLQRRRLSIVGKTRPVESVCPRARGFLALQDKRLLAYSVDCLFIVTAA